jgi:hypothetical protein
MRSDMVPRGISSPTMSIPTTRRKAGSSPSRKDNFPWLSSSATGLAGGGALEQATRNNVPLGSCPRLRALVLLTYPPGLTNDWIATRLRLRVA